MGKVYVGQSYLRLYVETDTDLSSASSVTIEGTKPDGTSTTSFNTVIEDATSGLIYYMVTSSDFTISGTYILWTKVNYSGGALSFGEPFHLNVYDEGN